MMDTNNDMDEHNLDNRKDEEKDQGYDKGEEENEGEEREKYEDLKMDDVPKEPTQTSNLTSPVMGPLQGERPISSIVPLDPQAVIQVIPQLMQDEEHEF